MAAAADGWTRDGIVFEHMTRDLSTDDVIQPLAGGGVRKGGEISAVYRAIPSRINVHKYSPALLCTERRKCSMKRAVLEAKQFKKYEFSTKFSNDMAWCLYDHH